MADFNLTTSGGGDSIVGKIALGIIRHFVGVAFSGLVVHGYMTGAQDQEAIGAVMVLVSIGFSVYDKMQAREAQAAAVQAAFLKSARMNSNASTSRPAN